MGAPLELIQELDSSISHSTDERRSVMLRHLTDLFLVGSDQYSEEEVDLIDDVFVRLVATIEQSSRALLSLRLAPVPLAPPKILRLLARDDAIEVAAPVLTLAEALDIGTLIECARTKNQEHLLAISRRKSLPDNLTDVLVERGDQQVVLSTAKNAGSRFSDKGFNTLIKRAHVSFANVFRRFQRRRQDQVVVAPDLEIADRRAFRDRRGHRPFVNDPRDELLAPRFRQKHAHRAIRCNE